MMTHDSYNGRSQPLVIGNQTTNLDFGAQSRSFVDVMQQVDRIAGIDSPVLLVAESCTARRLLASAIHHRSDRRERPFLVINCGAVPADQVGAELTGILEEADGGTLFLDDVHDTSLSLQVKFLDLFQSSDPSARVIAGTKCDLGGEVSAGRFINDLYSRIKTASIVLPSSGDSGQAQTALAGDDEWVTLSEIEGRYVSRVLDHTCGNKQAAARVLQVDRKTLDRMIKRHNIDAQLARSRRKSQTA